MENYVVYLEENNDWLLLTKKWNEGERVNTIPLKKFKRVDDLLNNVKVFTAKEVNEMCSKNLSLNSISLFDFSNIVISHKCKCSKNCMNFVYGGFYNIPNVGGVCIECYDRISKNGKLSPYKVMLALQKKN